MDGDTEDRAAHIDEDVGKERSDSEEEKVVEQIVSLLLNQLWEPNNSLRNASNNQTLS
jgi:hypothetical protein